MSDELLAAWLALSTQAESQIAATAAAYEAGLASTDRFIEAAAATVYAANLQATAYADTAVTMYRLARVASSPGTLGLTPPADELERLIRAFATIAAHAQAMSLTDRAARVARAEPLDRGRRAYQEALRARGATAWRRVVQPDACDDCAALAGTEEPIDVDFTDHPGCRCTLGPADASSWADAVRTRQYQLRRTFDWPQGQARFSAGIRFR